MIFHRENNFFIYISRIILFPIVWTGKEPLIVKMLYEFLIDNYEVEWIKKLGDFKKL